MRETNENVGAKTTLSREKEHLDRLSIGRYDTIKLSAPVLKKRLAKKHLFEWEKIYFEDEEQKSFYTSEEVRLTMRIETTRKRIKSANP